MSLRLDLRVPLPGLADLGQAQSVEILAEGAEASRLEEVLAGLRAQRRLKSLCLRGPLGWLPPALGELAFSRRPSPP